MKPLTPVAPGARVALGINLNDSWTLTPSVMAQKTKANGTFAFDPSQGDLQVAHALPDIPSVVIPLE